MRVASRMRPEGRAKKRYSPQVYAESASYAHVAAAVAAANAGDTVIVPAGTETWSDPLTIDKRIWLIGAGSGSTVITAGHSSGFLLNYVPTDSLSSDFFRLSGFTFAANGSRALFRVFRDSTSTSWMRVDHCVFAGVSSFLAMWEINGAIWGVVDHNTFGATGEYVHIDNYGIEPDLWEALSFAPGTVNNLYYEDNAFTFTDTLFTGGHCGRYALRYNTITLTGSHYPILDAHGNQTSGIYATMGVEVYGNRVSPGSGYNNQNYWLDHRGGKAMVFANKLFVTSTVECRIRDEYADSISPPATNPIDGTPQRPNAGYYWNNRRGASGTTLFHAVESTDVEGLMEENKNWWNHTDSFDGSGGVGYGVLGSRPESASNTGCAYWATTQDCTAISDDHVGVDPVTPLSGTLYRWTGSAWESYFTPYTYPHPFTTVE